MSERQTILASLPRFAISVRQPWAWMITCAGKDIENRFWRSYFKGRCAIHSPAQTVPHYDDVCDAIEDDYGIVVPDEVALGGLVGEVTVKGCVESSRSKWFSGPFGFIMEDAKAYDAIIPCRGERYFFEVRL